MSLLPPTAKPPLTMGGIALISVGLLLLIFPGGCSLYVLLMALPDIFTGPNDPYLRLIYAPVAIGLVIAAFGCWLLRVGLRWRRPASPPNG